MKKEFKFVDLDKTILPTAKGKNQDGFRFYSIDGQNYPSVTSVLGVKKKKELAIVGNFMQIILLEIFFL